MKNNNLILSTDNSNSIDLILIGGDNLDFNKGSLSLSGHTDDIAFYYDFSIYNDVNNIYPLYQYQRNNCSGDTTTITGYTNYYDNSSGNTITGYVEEDSFIGLSGKTYGKNWTGVTLNDIGLTGTDTGYVSQLSGLTLTITGKTLILKPVTGITQNYNLYITGETITNKNLIHFNGGFYQGFYKLFNFPYEVIPNRTPKGYTLDFWLKRDIDLITGRTLNSDNFFFFMGSRAENKFYNIFSGETGLTTTGGNFLTQNTGTTTDVNGIGFFYNDNSVGYKNIINRIDNSGNTLVRIDTSAVTINIDTGNTWINLSITFTRNMALSFCDDCENSLYPSPKIIKIYEEGCEEEIPDTQKGTLRFFLNGRPIYETIIEEAIFKELQTEFDKQEGVPYNISIGGGSQGLLETQTFHGPDVNDENLFMQQTFGGTFNGFIGSAAMYTKPLSIPEIIRNFNLTKSIYKREENFGGIKIIIDQNLIE